MKNVYLLGFLLLSSCDAVVGDNGVVVNAQTNERLSGVSVRMTSEKGASAVVLTDSIGYFDTRTLANYYDNEYTITFRKQGFELEIIDEKYFRAETTEFVTAGTKDTLVVKLSPE
ncbi:MAG: hypothetical protein AAF740_01435 [Bacteroidota bacterium]